MRVEHPGRTADLWIIQNRAYCELLRYQALKLTEDDIYDNKP